MPKTELQLRFRIWGPDLDPESLTAVVGIAPTKSFHVGELAGRAAHDVAGWEWWSEWSDSNISPLVEHFVELFSPHVKTLCSCVEAGATVRMKVVGELVPDLVESIAEAEKRGYALEADEIPFLDSDRIGLAFDVRAVRLLASVSASLDTHIDVELLSRA